MNKVSILTRSTGCLIAYGMLAVTSTVVGAVATDAHGSWCKYSVRDVAFVNVHGKSWQLELVKPGDVEEATFSQWSEILAANLKTANIGYVWHPADSERTKQLRAVASLGTSHPQMYLSDRSGKIIPYPNSGQEFETAIVQLVNSPIRTEILNKLVDSLCVFLVIRGEDKGKNKVALEIVQSATDQLERQLWMLEKASDHGPAIVTVDAADPAEALALATLDVMPQEAEQLPSVAVVFGQARRLGDSIVGEQLNQKALITRASICGSDCECALDRDWLYGAQMVHNWSTELERRAEDSLNFDPKSAFVMAEVSQILQKNGTRNSDQNLLQFGSGLMIHDLESLESSNDKTNQSGNTEASPEIDVSLSPKTQVTDSVSDNNELNTANTQTGAHLKSDVAADVRAGVSNDDAESGGGDIPWYLFGGLAIVTIVVFLIKAQKS